jgi:hypothetical protein
MQAISGGSGAPIKNETGRLLVPLRDDPSITFKDSTRNYVENDLRYKMSPNEQTAYRQELDKIVQQEKNRKKTFDKFGTSEYSNVSITRVLNKFE